MGPLIISAATVALFGDTPTMRGGAIMIAIAAASAMASVFGIMTLIAVIIAGSAALSGMVSPTYDDYGYYAGGCGWLYRRALITRSPYWWNRYHACINYYY
jgi:hypothetical protein